MKKDWERKMERKSAFIQLTIPVKMTYIVTQKYSKTAKERRKKKGRGVGRGA